MSVRQPGESMEESNLSAPTGSPTAPTSDATPSHLDVNVIEEVDLTTEHSLGSLSEKCVGVLGEKHEHRLDDVGEEASVEEDAYISFASGWVVTGLSYLIFLIILAANLYAIVMLALGRTG